MKKKTLILSHDTFLYLFKLSAKNLDTIERNADFSDDDCKDYNWMKEDREKAKNEISIAKRLHEALLFGEDEE